MDWNKLNPIDWIKSAIREIENIHASYLLAFLSVYILLFHLPINLINKLELFKYIGIISIFFICSIVLLLGKFIKIISSKIEKFISIRKILKYLDTLNMDEQKALQVGISKNQQTIYMNYNDSAGISLIQKNLVIKCNGEQKDYDGLWPYIIQDYVWNRIKPKCKDNYKIKQGKSGEIIIEVPLKNK